MWNLPHVTYGSFLKYNMHQNLVPTPGNVQFLISVYTNIKLLDPDVNPESVRQCIYHLA